MAISSAIVLFAVIWFMTLLIALPIGLRTQGDEKDVVPGTPESAPANLRLGRKLIWVTVITILLWVPLVALILSGRLTMESIDLFNRLDSHY